MYIAGDPRGWPTPKGEEDVHEVSPWEDEKKRGRWRGFCAVVRELASQHEHSVTEFCININYLNTGVNFRIFEEPSEDYENLVRLLQRPGFSRIDLGLLVR